MSKVKIKLGVKQFIQDCELRHTLWNNIFMEFKEKNKKVYLKISENHYCQIFSGLSSLTN